MKTMAIALPVMLHMGCCAFVHASPEAALLQADRDFARLSEELDPKRAFAAYLAPNVILLSRAGSPVEGYDNALASFGEEPGFALLWQPQLAEVAASGEMGWTWGTYQVIVDGRQVSSGKYVNIWALQADGSWKVRMDMGSQDPAPESANEDT
jgi:ketosteroid isomerase-like protein